MKLKVYLQASHYTILVTKNFYKILEAEQKTAQ